MMIRNPHSLHHRGAVMVMMLLALILLASLVFYVFNLGRAAQQRIVAQHAADATAIAGAGWVARSLNTIARNNVGIARSIALVNMMDSVPTAVRHTTIDQIALEEILSSQLSRGVSDGWVEDALMEVHDAVEQEIIVLNAVDIAINQSGFDIRTLTYYDGPNGRGKFWAAMESMDAVSQASMNRLGEAAQLAAIDGGQLNLKESKSSLAMLLPGVIDIPIERGEFDDFEPAVGSDTNRGGLTPQAVAMADDDQWYLYRGPFDTVFGWQYLNVKVQRWSSGSSRGGVPIGSSSQGTWENVDPDPTSYSVYGPQRWMMHQLAQFRRTFIAYSRFALDNQLINERSIGQTNYWMNELSQIRRSYLWPGKDTQQVVHPKWENSFTRAASIAETSPTDIHHTRFIIVEIKSKYPRTHSSFGSDGTWQHVSTDKDTRPRVYLTRGWTDPRTWGVEQVDRYIWRDEWEYPTLLGDSSIGIPPAVDDEGNVIAQKVYRIDEFMFGGVDIGEKEDVDNPHNFAGKGDLPAPIDFIHEAVPIDDTSRLQYFTYLGLVQQDSRATLWSRRFDGPTPRARLTLAQARVFNNHSWDLWTPMWHVQLEPITDYDNWLATLERDMDTASSFDALADVDFDDLLNQLTSLGPLVELGMTH